MKRFFVLLLFCVIVLGNVRVKALETGANSAIVMDGISGEVLYAKNINQKLPMASTTKIMTALILCESVNLDDEVFITDEMVAVEGSSMGLKSGIRVKYSDLLYGMLLASGNDAANATAIAIGGSVENFIEIMNSRARKLGLLNTCFETPSGLDGKNHYTTAYDLAVLTREALKNDIFAAAAKTKSISLSYGGVNRTLVNHNRLLNEYDGAVGVKTGFTKKAGRCLVSAAERDGALIIAVTLNDGNDWQDHKAMLDYGFKSLSDEILRFSEQQYSISVSGGEEDFVTVKSDKVAFRTVNGKNIIKKEYILPTVSAPVKAGDYMGCVEYYCDNSIVAKQRLYADRDIKRTSFKSGFSLFLHNFLKLINFI